MVVAIAIRSSALSDIEAGCPGYQSCPATLRGRYDTGVTASTLTNVFGGLAAAGIGAGVTMLVLSRGSNGSGEPRAAVVGIAPMWDGARVHAIVRF